MYRARGNLYANQRQSETAKQRYCSVCTEHFHLGNVQQVYHIYV